MNDKQRKRIHDITYSCDDRAEIAERIVRLEDENEKLREAAEHDADVLKSMNLLLEESLKESAKLRELLDDLHGKAPTSWHYGALVSENECTKTENEKLRELLLDCWDFSNLMHGSMASRYLELGLIGEDEARELGIGDE